MSFFRKLGQAIGSVINSTTEKTDATDLVKLRRRTDARIAEMVDGQGTDGQGTDGQSAAAERAIGQGASGGRSRDDQIVRPLVPGLRGPGPSDDLALPLDEQIPGEFPQRLRQRDLGEALLNQLLEETARHAEYGSPHGAEAEETYPSILSIMGFSPADKARVFAMACWAEVEAKKLLGSYANADNTLDTDMGMTVGDLRALWRNFHRLVCRIGPEVDPLSDDQALIIFCCLKERSSNSYFFREYRWYDTRYEFRSDPYIEIMARAVDLVAEGPATPRLRRGAIALLESLIESDTRGRWQRHLARQLFTILSDRDYDNHPAIAAFAEASRAAQTLCEEMTTTPSQRFNDFVRDLLDTNLPGRPLRDQDFVKFEPLSDLSPAERAEVLVQAVVSQGRILKACERDRGLKGSWAAGEIDHVEYDYQQKFMVSSWFDERPMTTFLQHLVRENQKRALDLSDEHLEILFDHDLDWSSYGINLQILRAIGKSMKRGARPRALAAARRFVARREERLGTARAENDKDLQKIRKVMGLDEGEAEARERVDAIWAVERTPEIMDRDARSTIEKIESLINAPSDLDFREYFENSTFGPKHHGGESSNAMVWAATLAYSSHVQSKTAGAEFETRSFAETFHESPYWSDATVARMEALLQTAGRHLEDTANQDITESLAQAAGHRLDDTVTRKVTAMLKGYRFFRDHGQRYSLAWNALERHADLMEERSKPTRQWLNGAVDLTTGLDTGKLIRMLLDHLERRFTGIREGQSSTSKEETRLRGLIYMASAWPHDDLAPALSHFARDRCFNNGLSREKVGNAVLWYLQTLPDGAGLPYLARLVSRVKYPKVRKRIDGILNQLAEKAGIARGALEELAVPVHHFDKDGRAELPVGGGAALLRISGTSSIELTWRTPEGRVVKSVPKAFTEDEETRQIVNGIKREIKEAKQDLSIQVPRLQRLYLDDRKWPATDWIERYGDHPLVSQVSRRLIWNAHRDGRRISGLWREGSFQDITGEAVDLEGAEITLWHPLENPAEGLAWRDRLAELEIVQPFRQAHREVYVVTDAERRTNTYSNRFAGHILMQNQMMALARINNWKITQRVAFDTPNDQPTHLVIPAHGLIAEYWTEGTGDPESDITEGFGYLYLTTDQVRFYGIDPAGNTRGTGYDAPRGEVVAMNDVPALVFSEVMRQVDLFVGVASIANDPRWGDAGAAAEHPSQWGRSIAHDYWQARAFAALEEQAKTRMALLQPLLPALSIAGRCAIDGKFLRVEGSKRTYKIHLGSSNILMEPDDRYLCIVPGQARAGDKDASRVRLPFEGDGTLSLILSKAFLLAADDKITDPVILNQIGRGESP